MAVKNRQIIVSPKISALKIYDTDTHNMQLKLAVPHASDQTFFSSSRRTSLVPDVAAKMFSFLSFCCSSCQSLLLNHTIRSRLKVANSAIYIHAGKPRVAIRWSVVQQHNVALRPNPIAN